jgi:Reverse transcriptase (RNA-dependent DNA polymerase)
MLLFADDTTLFHSDKNFVNLINTTNVELDKLAVWFRANKLSLNVKKTNYMLFGHKSRPDTTTYNLVLHNHILEQVTSVKFLGIYIDEKLTWNQHVINICKKLSSGVGMIGRLRFIFPSAVLLTLYYALVYPYICYCCVIWGNSCMSALNSAIVLQNRAIRIITNSPYRSSAGPLYVNLNLLKLVDLHKFQSLLFMYKSRLNALSSSCVHYFTVNPISSHNTRHGSYFQLQTCRTNIRKKNIRIYGPALWNTLPIEIQYAHSFAKFKQSLKHWIIESSIDE